MTTIYFIRHAEADNTNRDGRNRPLTAKGLADRILVTEFLQDKNIDAVLSSPFKRAIDTVADFAEKNGFEIQTVEDFRERKSDSDWLRDTDFFPFIERQWADFSYSLSDGECLDAVQRRNIAALNEVLMKYKDKTVVIGTHGTALATIINYFDNTYGFDDFMAMVNLLPWIVKMTFNDDGCICIEKFDLISPQSDKEECEVRIYELNTLKAYRFSVVFARYQDKWLYCRAKDRDCYETAGGNIHSGETTLEAAKRELYEETGAIKFDIKPVFDFTAPTTKGNYSWNANAQVFFAHVHELGEMPGFEMAEVKLFDTIPDKMRFPQILPVLFEKVKTMI